MCFLGILAACIIVAFAILAIPTKAVYTACFVFIMHFVVRMHTAKDHGDEKAVCSAKLQKTPQLKPQPYNGPLPPRLALEPSFSSSGSLEQLADFHRAISNRALALIGLTVQNCHACNSGSIFS